MGGPQYPRKRPLFLPWEEVRNMGAIIQQNSDMVEQSSAETRRLKDEVETLIELLRRFRARPEGRSAGAARRAA
jgi:methyl-accepting chemotaxis protein